MQAANCRVHTPPVGSMFGVGSTLGHNYQASGSDFVRMPGPTVKQNWQSREAGLASELRRQLRFAIKFTASRFFLSAERLHFH